MSNIKGRFPDLLPMEELRVGPETHTYEVIEYDDTPNAVKEQYVPNKAPVLEVENITGVVNGDDYSFEQGTDYEIIDTDNDGRLETIDFGVGGVSPDDNTDFEITYLARSIIVRYVESYEDEFDRVTNDINEVINSHYVDTATNTGYIDSFEDEEIVEYTTDYCQGSINVQSSVVLQGNWALKMQSECKDDPLTITSTSGLERYPKRGDTFTYYMQLTNDGDIGYFDFMYQNGTDDRYYSVQIDSKADEFILQKDGGNTKKDTASVDLSTYFGEWMQVEVSVSPIGDIVATLIDEDNNDLVTVTIVDTEYTSGGIRWRAFNDSGTGIVYADAADIIQRNSSDLDRIGAIFGELGKRRGRTDDEYSTFLRSIVQSFSGRGTVDGIKFAVASALDLPPDQILVTEDFVENEYVVRITTPFPPHQLQTLTELADLADPSGVRFASISYDVADEEVGFSDNVSITEGIDLGEDMVVDDEATVDPNLRTTDDDVSIADVAAVDQNQQTADEDVSVDDTTSVTVDDTASRWDQQETNWDFFEWQQIDDLVRTLSEQAGVVDSVTINGNLVTVNDEMVADDAAFIDQNALTVSDAMSSDDAVQIDQNKTTVSDGAGSHDVATVDQNTLSSVETTGSDESVTVSTTLVAWGLGGWNTMTWTKEHN